MGLDSLCNGLFFPVFERDIEKYGKIVIGNPLYHRPGMSSISKLVITGLCAWVFFALTSPAFAFLALTDGTIVKGYGPEVYVLENGMKRWVSDASSFNALELDWDSIVTIEDADLLEYPRAKNNLDQKSKLPDGLLVREDQGQGGDGVKVYRVAKGSRRWIQNEQDFDRLGLEWRSVHEISPKKMKTLPSGKALSTAQFVTRPLTIIQQTPEKVVEDPEVVFRFTGVTLRQDKRALTFETYLEGVDSGWRSGGVERRISLPKKGGTYRLFARAKDFEGNVDKTPKSYTFELKLSPYFDEVSISGSPRSANIAQEQITLQNRGTQSITLAGWTLESKERHTSYALPVDAYEIPDQPYYQYTAPLQLTKKTKIVVYTGASPLGVNFRLNKCIGYLSVYHTFTPPLPTLCPKPTKIEVQNYSAYCQKTVSSLAACKEPNLSDPLLDQECRDFLKERFGYSKCVERNNTYYDFLMDEVRVYLNRPSDIWINGSDTVLLRDNNGLLVAKYKY